MARSWPSAKTGSNWSNWCRMARADGSSDRRRSPSKNDSLGDSTMTFNNANHSRPAASTCRAGAFGLAVGLLAALGGAHAAPASAVAVGIAQSVPVSPLDPAKRTPARIEVADIDFNRGEGGSGKLTLRFDQP